MKIRNVHVVLFLFAILFASSSVTAIEESQIISPGAAEAVEAEVEEPMSGIFSGERSSSAALSLLGYAVILGGLCVAAWYFFKRGLIRKPFAKGEGKLKVAETRMLGNRQFIMVVEYEDQKILLGVGPGKIDYLTNLQAYRGDFPQIEPTSPVRFAGGAD